MGHYSKLEGSITISPALLPEHKAMWSHTFSHHTSWRVLDDSSHILPPIDAVKQPYDLELQRLISMYFVPLGYRLDGEVRWDGEETGDTGILRVTANRIEMLADEQEPLSTESMEQVMNLLKSRNPDDISRAGNIIDYFNLQISGASEVLAEHLQDPVMEVRWRAAECLMLLGTEAEPAIPALIEALNDPHEWVRSAAAWALGAIGPKATIAEPALKKLLSDPSYGPRGRAQEALASIQGNATT